MKARAWLFLWAMSVVGCMQTGDLPDPAGTVLVFKHGRLSGDGQVLSGLLREFEQRHPGVVVREEVLPASSDRQHQYYAMNLDGGKAPFDLLGVDTIWVQEFAKAGWLSPLDNLILPSEQHEFFPGPIDAATFEGRLYALPWYIDAGVLYYRRDLLDRHGLDPPRTWPELVRAATVVLDAEHNNTLAGFLWQGKQYEGLICTASEVLWSFGADLWTGDWEQAEAGLQFLRETISKFGITPLSVSMADEESTRLIFGNGRALFMRNWPYAWSLLQREGSPVRGKIGVAPIPSLPGHAGSPVLGGWLLAIPRHSPRQEMAGQLVRFLSSPHAQRRIAMELGYNPTRLALYDEEPLLKARPFLKDLYPIFLSARPRPLTPYYLLLSQAAQPEVSAVVVGRKTPREALAAVRSQAERFVPMPQISSKAKEL
jgi:multiple sugar transport system substrate-binding protein